MLYQSPVVIVWTLFLIVTRVRSSSNVGNFSKTEYPCKTPDNKDGNCVNLYNCEPLNQLKPSSYNPEVLDFIRRSLCGPKRSVPFVCCPIQAKQESYTNTCGTSTKSVAASRILGGQNATLGDWPWMAALAYRSIENPGISFRCGGSLISNRYVLTAAHCVHNTGSYKILGDLDLDINAKDGANPITVGIKKIHVHPNYTINPIKNDIALIRLQDSLSFRSLEHIRPVCLRSGEIYRKNDYYNNKKLYVIGWGVTSPHNTKTTMLQEVTVNVINNKVCAKNYADVFRALIDEYVLCAIGDGKDNCSGDSGGPLLIQETSIDGSQLIYYLVGVVSYGANPCRGTYKRPGVYMRVAQYTDWINEVTGEQY